MKLRTRIAAALGAAALAAGLLAGCGSSDDSLRPTAYGPTWGGHTYCGWVASPLECTNSGISSMYWHQLVEVEPAGWVWGGPTLADALFGWRMEYDPWYASSSYYNVYVPSSYRRTYVSTHVILVEHRYTKIIHSAETHAVYKTSSGKKVTNPKPSRFATARPTTRSTRPATKATSKPRSTNNGGSRHSSGCNALVLPHGDQLLDKTGGGSSGSKSSSKVGGSRGKGTTSRRGC